MLPLQASHGRTTIIIAHRLSTIQGADVIAAIVNGQLAESGNHQTLLLKKGVYFDLVQAQVTKLKDMHDNHKKHSLNHYSHTELKMNQ